MNSIATIEELKALSIAAGKILLDYQTKLSTLKIKKKQSYGVASEADLASEEFLMSSLKKLFPKHDFLGEESSFTEEGYHYDNLLTEKEYLWAIDPLDGTNNFLQGLSYFCISLGLLKKGVPILGMIYRPFNQDCFWAIQGEGAFLQRAGESKATQLKLLQKEKELADSMFCTGGSFLKSSRREMFFELNQEAKACRLLGSAALDLAYTTFGLFDGMWYQGLHPWDTAAGTLLAQEAGLKVTDFFNKPFSVADKSLVVARPLQHERLISRLAESSRN